MYKFLIQFDFIQFGGCKARVGEQHIIPKELNHLLLVHSLHHVHCSGYLFRVQTRICCTHLGNVGLATLSVLCPVLMCLGASGHVHEQVLGLLFSVHDFSHHVHHPLESCAVVGLQCPIADSSFLCEGQAQKVDLGLIFHYPRIFTEHLHF